MVTLVMIYTRFSFLGRVRVAHQFFHILKRDICDLEEASRMILGCWWNESRSCCPTWVGSFATRRSVADCKQLIVLHDSARPMAQGTLGRVEGDLMSGSYRDGLQGSRLDGKPSCCKTLDLLW